jgi:peptidoglycan/LPS O-acetylase OafA/YrhL
VGVLRLLLALAVVVSHTGGQVLGYRPISGPHAVEAFYVISGFYMALVMDGKYGTSRREIVLFWQNRYLRLAPTYWVVFAVALVHTLWRKRSGELLTALPAMNAGSVAFVVVVNVLIIGQDLTNFVGFTPEAGERGFHFVSNLWAGSTLPGWHFLLVPPAWTVALELMFYTLVPWLARRRSRTLVVLALASLALRLLIYGLGHRHDPWTYRFFPNELIFFLAGMLSYRLYRHHPWDSLPAAAKVTLGLAFLAFPLAAGYGSVAFVYALALPLLLPAIFAMTRRLAWDNRIGELSYPLYISHWMFLHLGERRGRWAPFLVAALSLGCAALLVRFVEHPVNAFRQRRLAQANARP